MTLLQFFEKTFREAVAQKIEPTEEIKRLLNCRLKDEGTILRLEYQYDRYCHGREGKKETGPDVVILIRNGERELMDKIGISLQMENRRRVRRGGSRVDYAFQILDESTSSSGS